MDAEHECNINNIKCNDLYQSPMKKKVVSRINDSVYNESDEHVDTISDSRNQVDPRNDPIKDTHIVDGVCTLSIGFRPHRNHHTGQHGPRHACLDKFDRETLYE